MRFHPYPLPLLGRVGGGWEDKTGEQELCKPPQSKTKWSPGGRGRWAMPLRQFGQVLLTPGGMWVPILGAGGSCCPEKLEKHSPSPLPPSQWDTGHKNLSRSLQEGSSASNRLGTSDHPGCQLLLVGILRCWCRAKPRIPTGSTGWRCTPQLHPSARPMTWVF